MRTNIILILTLTLIIFLIVGCAKQDSNSNILVGECEQACQNALAKVRNLSQGPCLLDPMSNPEWVCDIAHNPRGAVDNLLENQCTAFHNQSAKHFIELNSECELIRVY